jgi:hypothetical protein
MSSNVYSVGLNNVGSYQVSGMPFASGSLSAIDGSAKVIYFPYVTSWVQVINHETDTRELKVAFSENGLSGDNHFKLHAQQNANKGGTYGRSMDLKITELWFTGSQDFDVVAGLTNIPVARIDNLSGSGGGIVGNNWSGSVGVG